MSNDNIHRLEGSGEVKGGLVIRKKKPDDDFKVPAKASLLGLDKLAAVKVKERRENEENAAKKFKSDKNDFYSVKLNKNVFLNRYS